MAKESVGSKSSINQTNRKSLKVHQDALKVGRQARGTGILVKHESQRTPGQSPVIVLREVAYQDLCAIGEKFLAYKWVAPSHLQTAGPRAEPDCQGRSCTGGACPEPCVCDPVTLRCVRVSI
jgi:hypothetical protein